MNDLDKQLLSYYATNAQIDSLTAMLDAYIEPVKRRVMDARHFADDRYLADNVREDVHDYVVHVYNYLIDLKHDVIRLSRMGNFTQGLLDHLVNRVDRAMMGANATNEALWIQHDHFHVLAQNAGNKMVDHDPNDAEPAPSNAD